MEKETYPRKVNKSASSGLIVSKEYAKEHPKEVFADKVLMPKHLKPRSASGVIKRLKELTKGLLLDSENDYPYKTVLIKLPESQPNQRVTFEILKRDLSEHAGTLSFYEQNFDEFIAQRLRNEIPLEMKEQYKALQQFYHDNLKNVTVFRIGSIQIQVYLVGVAVDGNIVGCKSFSIET